MTRNDVTSYCWLISSVIGVPAVLAGVAIVIGGTAIHTTTPVMLVLGVLLLLTFTVVVLWRVMALRRQRRHRQDMAILASQILAQQVRTRAAMAALWRQQARDHFEIIQRGEDIC